MDKISPAERSDIMRKIKAKGTSLEKEIQKSLRRRRIYFAPNVPSIFGKPDLAFRRKRVVVFLDSCYWHGCPKHCRLPSTRKHYWKKKILRNRQRDKRVNSVLRRQGWKVLRFWEHTLTTDLESCITKIISS